MLESPGLKTGSTQPTEEPGGRQATTSQLATGTGDHVSPTTEGQPPKPAAASGHAKTSKLSNRFTHVTKGPQVLKYQPLRRPLQAGFPCHPTCTLSNYVRGVGPTRKRISRQPPYG